MLLWPRKAELNNAPYNLPAKRRHSSVKRVKRRLEIECLEDRCTPATQLINNQLLDVNKPGGEQGPGLLVNMQITAAFVCDGNAVAQAAPVLGQKVILRANWTVTNSGSEQYLVRFTVDGITIDSGTVTNAGNGGYYWYLGGWYATPGTHTAVVTIDGANQVAESNESDNQITFNYTTVAPFDLPSQFSLYTSGVLNQDWFIGNYADVDPRVGIAADYRGGVYQYDGHDAHDSGPQAQYFNAQDMGIPLIAAADGTVSQVVDGNFDRESAQNNRQGNYILLDHGNSWQTLYYHAAANTIVVKVGDQVKRGQLLGYMGSSGNSTGTHIHFTPLYRNAVVETGYAPSTYWVNPPTYSGDVPTTLFAAGMTNFAPSYTELSERISSINSFSTSEPGTASFWTTLWNFKTTDTLTWRWIRPNNTFFDNGFNPSQTYQRFSWWYWSLPLSNFQGSPGTWQVAMRLNGTEIRRYSFTIGGSSVSSIKMLGPASQPLIDERTTPFDFGSTALGGSALQQSFTIQNHGNGILNLSNLVLPTGFSLAGSFPATVAANSSATLTLQLDSARAGSKFGMVKFDTNDPDTPTFNFNLSGTVTGAALAGAPVVALPGTAVEYDLLDLPRFLFPLGTITDSDSANFNGGSLTVTPDMGNEANDRLAINSQGNGAGQIGVAGSTVSYGGVAIGTFTGGTGAGGNGITPLVISFNSNATPTAAQALLRQITYRSLLTVAPVQLRRYYHVTVVDNTAKASNEPVKLVDHSGVRRAPTVAALPAQSVTNGLTLNQAGSFTDPYGFSWTASVDYGDGSGTLPLTLNPDKSYTLNHQYTAGAGVYTATVSVWSDQGGINTSTFQTTVSTPIQVSSVQIDSGAAQRSQVIQLLVNFSRAVTTVDAGAFSLSVVNSIGVIPTLNVAWNGSNTVATITFSGAGVVAGSIADGRYQLNLDATKFHDNTGGVLDGNLDGLSGGSYAGQQFHRLFGDANGNGIVDSTDRDLFFAALGSSTGNPNYSSMFDYNGDGIIDFNDYAQFRNRFGSSV